MTFRMVPSAMASNTFLLDDFDVDESSSDDGAPIIAIRLVVLALVVLPTTLLFVAAGATKAALLPITDRSNTPALTKTDDDTIMVQYDRLYFGYCCDIRGVGYNGEYGVNNKVTADHILA